MIDTYEVIDIYNDIGLTTLERRKKLERLLRDSDVHTQYMSALASFVRQTRTTTTSSEAEDVVDEIINSDEMRVIDKLIMAIMLSLIYGGSSKDYLVPMCYLPSREQNYVYR